MRGQTPIRSAMILAAGRGERMRPSPTARPNLSWRPGDRPLIGHHLAALARRGCARSSSTTHTSARRSRRRSATAPLTAPHPLLAGRNGAGDRRRHRPGPAAAGAGSLHPWSTATSGRTSRSTDCASPTPTIAHLVLVTTRPTTRRGLRPGRRPGSRQGGPRLHLQRHARLPSCPVRGLQPRPLPLAPLLRAAMAAGRVSGEHHRGR